ncbi:MAG: hypothetical protein A4E42_00991 [Methanoregulaceae archaeon PtaU1.Bin222]|nr:MAG: hypothetical protein A4E42_00991 [Methanoregulaceae archaeon PtaU1.Bin222]
MIETACSAMIGIGVRDNDAGQPLHGTRHPFPDNCVDLMAVDTIPRVNHHALAGAIEEKDIPAAGGLDTDEAYIRSNAYLLDIRVEFLTTRIAECLPGPEDALEHDLWILPPVHQFLDDMVNITEQPEQESILGFPDKTPDCLGKPEVEDGIIK